MSRQSIILFVLLLVLQVAAPLAAAGVMVHGAGRAPVVASIALVVGLGIVGAAWCWSLRRGGSR